MKLKGKTTIELTDVNTGELTTVEQENMLTNVLPDFFNHNPMGLFNSMSDARTLKYFNKHFLPICPNLLGGYYCSLRRWKRKRTISWWGAASSLWRMHLIMPIRMMIQSVAA